MKEQFGEERHMLVEGCGQHISTIACLATNLEA